MKAIGVMKHGGPEVLEVIDLPEMNAGPGQIRIRNYAAAVNPVDVSVRNGSMAAIQAVNPPPYVPGMDAAGTVDQIEEQDGSWKFFIKYDSSLSNITVNKGSITINGTSLTVVDSFDDKFSVCIIPYTFEHTNFKDFKVGSIVNLEFDIVGKYLTKLHSMNK